MPNNKLKSFTIKGYKSIKSIENFEPHPINILIGPNGAGKSNFISFFKFLSWMLSSRSNQSSIFSLPGFYCHPIDQPRQ